MHNKKKIVKLYKKSEAPKSKIYLKDFQYLKKLGEGQFGQVFLVKNVQYGTNLYAIKCLSK
jgi:serine/threonine protein kinase